MKRKLYLVILLVAICLVSSIGFAACGKKNDKDDDNVTDIPEEFNDKGEWTIKSPDGTLACQVVFDAYGDLYYTVKKGNTQIVNKSTLGLDIKEDDFSFLTLQKQNSKEIKGSYENISGKCSRVEYCCNETTLTFKAWEFCMDVVVRVYDDGYAFRYNVRKIDGSEGTMTVNSENTTFVLPENSTIWAQDYASGITGKSGFSYETNYEELLVKDLTASQYLAMPAMYNVPNTNYYSLITESELIGSNYYGSFLKSPKGMDGKYTLKTEHTPAGIMIDDSKISYPFESPWRVGIVGDMKTVEESELVEKVYYSGEKDYTDLYWKPDNYDELSKEEQAIYNYDWVESGITAWSWLTNGYSSKQSDYDQLQPSYLALAKKMGWKYILLDGGWNSNVSESTIKQFVQDADRQGIKVMVWCDAFSSFNKGDVSMLTTKLAMWKSWGIAGIKVDFFDGQSVDNPPHQGEDSETIKWYESIYQECAKLKMLVNCHGSNKPTGERVKYPNVINREGIYGNEMSTVGATYTVKQLFIRNVVGPSDFTPVVNPLSKGLTKAHQLALSFLFESGTPSMADRADVYQREDITDFFKTIPSLRDKTVFLGGEMARYYSAAVKGGDYWFVGVANSLLKRDVTIDFSFLEDDGEYVAEVYSDDSTASKLEKQVITVKKNESKTFTILAKGGLAIRIYKKS